MKQKNGKIEDIVGLTINEVERKQKAKLTAEAKKAIIDGFTMILSKFSNDLGDEYAKEN